MCLALVREQAQRGKQHDFGGLGLAGCAGAVSRTLTAPVDRVKMILQVHIGPLTVRDTVRSMVAEGTHCPAEVWVVR